MPTIEQVPSIESLIENQVPIPSRQRFHVQIQPGLTNAAIENIRLQLHDDLRGSEVHPARLRHQIAQAQPGEPTTPPPHGDRPHPQQERQIQRRRECRTPDDRPSPDRVSNRFDVSISLRPQGHGKLSGTVK